MKRFFTILLSLLWAGIAFADDIYIGVLAYDGKSQAIQRWQPTANYLSQKIQQHQFQVTPLTHQEFEHSINKNELDFVLTNPAHYVRLEVRFGVTRIATFLAVSGSRQLNEFSSSIFTLKTSDINEFSDLAGKTLAAVSEQAFGGFQLMQDALLAEDFDVLAEMDVVWLGFPHTDVVNAVLSGKADVGTVRSGVLEIMASQKQLDLAQLRILGQKHNQDYPFLHSVGLYPEWPFSTLPKTNTLLAKKVAMALMQMPADNQATITSGGAGWTIPLDYARVHDVLRRLALEPYQASEFSFTDFWQRYRHWIMVSILLFCFGLYALLRNLLTNRKLRTMQQALQAHQAQLEITVQQRTDELLKTNHSLQTEIALQQKTEKTLDSACETLQGLYQIFTRDDLSRQQQLSAIVDSVRHYLNTEISLLSSYHDDHFEVCCGSTQELTAPLSEANVSQAIANKQIVSQKNTAIWHHYIACPIYIKGELHCLLEFATPQQEQINTHENGDNFSSELSHNILNLISQWIGHESALLESEQKIQDKYQALKQRFIHVSKREHDVLKLLAQGESTKSMARLLNLSTKTIEMHRASLLRKTGEKSSTEIVQLAVNSGLFSETQ